MNDDDSREAEESNVIRRKSQSKKPKPATNAVTESTTGTIELTSDRRRFRAPPATVVTQASRIGQSTRRVTAWILLFLGCSSIIGIVMKGLLSKWYQRTSPIIWSSRFSDAEILNLPLNASMHNTRAPETIRLKWNVTKGVRSPDGVEKLVYLINDEFPGPTVEATCGDTIELELFNSINSEDLALHFHGLEMRGYNDMDGAVGITQDPIPAGGNMTYRFPISESQTGTFWYHAHSEVQRGDGVFGSFVIHQPVRATDNTRFGNTHNVDEEHVVMISDWYHRGARDALSWYMRSGSFGMEPVPDSILVNGIGAFNCSNAVPARPIRCSSRLGSTVPKMTFEAGRLYRLRFINAGMLAGISLSISGEPMTVVRIDGGQDVEPTEATSFGILFPGQRVDVLIRWSAGGNEELSISLDEDSFRYPNPALTSIQSFPIEISGSPNKNLKQHVLQHIDLLRLSPAESPVVPVSANQTIVLYTTTLKLARLSNVPHGFINHTTWSPQSPALIHLSRSEYNVDQLIPYIKLTSPPQWIDVVINNVDEDDHPFHFHGHAPYVLQTHSEGWGLGSWNPHTKVIPPGGEFILSQALRRDTFVVPRRGYTVLRFKADNEGIWMLHCHVLWHLGSGMSMALEIGSKASQT